jgi:exopolysaccharide biosynthesis polyprenyl glycosylphosphotransferase
MSKLANPHSVTTKLVHVVATSNTMSKVTTGLFGSSSPSTRDFESHHRISARREDAHYWVIVSCVGDYIVATVAALMAFMLRFEVFQEVGYFKAQTFDEYIIHLMLGSATLVTCFAWLGIYRPAMLLQAHKVRRRILKGTMLWTAGFLLMALAFHIQPPISRIYMAINGLMTLPMILLWRQFLGTRLHQPGRLAALQQRAIVVGWNEDAVDLQQRLSANPEEAVEIAGWVATGDTGTNSNSGRIACLGHVRDLEAILSQNPADMVILADLSGHRSQSINIANLCEREMIGFKIIPSCFRVFVSGLQLENVGGTPILGVSRLPLDSTFNLIVKRAIDIVGSLVGLMISLPLIAIFGGIVYWESRGPILYRQRRTGANGKPFNIIKIRSMRLDAEKNGAQWCKAEDPRRLKIGEFMRKWNIDEVPQFWNVLKGEMSLVGPRPERPELIANFKHEIPHYNARHHAKPGMTGWAQVMGLRGDTSLTHRIKADLWYLENWCLILDIKVMILTFFKRDNAY